MTSDRSEHRHEVRARLGDLRIAPRKVRLVADLIKYHSLEQARQQLRFLTKKAARPLLKLINSAAANAQHNFKLEPQNLGIKSITVNQGYMTKRFKPRAQGRAMPIRRRTSIVEVVLVEKAGSPRAVKKKVESKKSVSDQTTSAVPTTPAKP